MGASESKSIFKQGVVRLSGSEIIPQDDQYWADFWHLPESVDDVFSLFTTNDIRRIRDEALRNLETLVTAVSSHLFHLRRRGFHDPMKQESIRHALNCIRILTRILPFLYEAEHLEHWEDKFFWSPEPQAEGGQLNAREEDLRKTLSPAHHISTAGVSSPRKPLGEELIDTLLDLLFMENFAIPCLSHSYRGVSLSIWQAGVGSTSEMTSNKDFESNRTEVLRLLLTLSSKSMYTSPSILPVRGIRALTYITTLQEQKLVTTLLCSLLNTTLSYDPTTWRTLYQHVVPRHPKQLYIVCSLELLLVLLLYPVPKGSLGGLPKNYFRHFLGKVHQPADFLFIIEGILRILVLPLQTASVMLTASHGSPIWAPEMIMLLWEMLQCNRRFRSFLINRVEVFDVLSSVMFQIMQHKSTSSRQGIVRLSCFVLQTLSAESSFGYRLNRRFEGHSLLPHSLQIPDFRGSYTDFLIISIHHIITTYQGKLDAIFPALLAILNNIAPHAIHLDHLSSHKLLELFDTMSSPAFLLASPTNYELLQALLRGINAIFEHQYENNPQLVQAVLTHRKRLSLLQNFIANGIQDERERLERSKKDTGADVKMICTSEKIFASIPTSMETRPSTVEWDQLGPLAIGGDTASVDDDTVRRAALSQATPSRSASLSGCKPDGPQVSVHTGALSERARGKLPASQGAPPSQEPSSDARLRSFASSEASKSKSLWVDSWARELPLETMSSIVEHYTPLLSASDQPLSTDSLLEHIRDTRPSLTRPSPTYVQSFEWTPLSLGWYESVLWGFIFWREVMDMKGVAGIWKGTAVKLFRVQDSAVQGPSLLAPRGAVDALGSNLVQTIGRLNVRGATPALSKLAAYEQTSPDSRR